MLTRSCWRRATRRSRASSRRARAPAPPARRGAPPSRRALGFGVIVAGQLPAVRGPARLSRMVYSGEHGPNIGPTEDVVWAAYFEPETVVVRVDYYDTEDEARAAFQALAVLGDRRPE